MAATLTKDERLHGRTAVTELVHRGRYGTEGCLRYCHAPNTLGYTRILVSVPKKHFKRAVKRNLLKRRMRESYRLLKENWNAQRPSSAPGHDIMFLYTAAEVQPYAAIHAAMAAILAKIATS